MRGDGGDSSLLQIVCDCSVRVRHPVGQRIIVCVRKRPLTLKECKRGVEDVVTAPSEQCVNVSERKESVDLRHYILQVHYTSVSMDWNPLLTGIKQPCSFQVFFRFPHSLFCAAQVLLWPSFWRALLQWGGVPKDGVSSCAAHAQRVRQNKFMSNTVVEMYSHFWKLLPLVVVVFFLLSVFLSNVFTNLCCTHVHPQRQRHLLCIWPNRCREDLHDVGFLSWETGLVHAGSAGYFCSYLYHTDPLTIAGVRQFLWNLLWSAVWPVKPQEKVCLFAF